MRQIVLINYIFWTLRMIVIIKFMQSINGKFKLSHKVSGLLGVKTILNLALMLFWAVIIVGTFKEFI